MTQKTKATILYFIFIAIVVYIGYTVIKGGLDLFDLIVSFITTIACSVGATKTYTHSHLYTPED